MSLWYEAGTLHVSTTFDAAWNTTITSGLTSPSVSTSRATNVTDPDSETDVTADILTGSASISTTTWTTPKIGNSNLAANSTYRVETDISDSGNVWTFVLFVKTGPY